MPTGEIHEIPLYEPVIGPKALDGNVLSKKTGMFTFDPGFTSTASCVS
jgi:citrate synthase